MTHEPECPESHNLVDANVDCPCEELRAAYQRGREDAAKAVNMLAASWKVDENGWQILGDCAECGGTYDAYNLAIDDAYFAARGDGEQA